MKLIRPLIIGESPSRTSDPLTPITGACGEVLARFCDMPLAGFKRRFARMNLLPSWPGVDGSKGTSFDVVAAQEFAAESRRRVTCGRVVILLGKRVAAAYGVKGDYFREQDLFGARIFVVPHPSGINRWYNVAANRLVMAEFMRRAARGRL